MKVQYGAGLGSKGQGQEATPFGFSFGSMDQRSTESQP